MRSSAPFLSHTARSATLGLVLCFPAAVLAQTAQEPVPDAAATAVVNLSEIRVVGTAEEELKQAPGVSIITREDIEKQPPTNDLSEIIRKMPGVNLTGNSATGQYGNNRQIDIRGMGPENTLILIDGKPVQSRNSVRMGRSGERNTRGDSNWVPVEAIERIEVIRGPAASRYGSGAAGGVVNIITRPPTEDLEGSATLYLNEPQHDDEGDTRRVSFNVSGPVVENLTFRVYGSYNRTDADSLDINRDASGYPEDWVPPAGREGVENKDLDALLRWEMTAAHILELEGGYSRQGNIYAGDRAVSSSGSDLIEELANEGKETNTLTRKTISLTHRGAWDFGTSRTLFQYEHTDNSRLNEGLAGGSEGSINSSETSTATLQNYFTNTEINVPLALGGIDQVVTFGGEWRYEKLDDPYSVSQSLGGGSVPGVDEGERDGKSDANTFALFVEENIALTDRLILTPGFRFDHHSEFGMAFSPALNASYDLSDWVAGLQVKGGIAQAFKAPNLYQTDPNYVYYTRGNGCPVDYPSLGGGCYIIGNENLKPETSINTELGLGYDRAGWVGTLTYFHNDYNDKIVAGDVPVGQAAGSSGNQGARIFQWTNASRAVVQGVEGSLLVPLWDTVSWTSNFTYMIENENKSTGEPLSIIPQYTINSWLDWQATQDLGFRLSMTHYGKQEPRNYTTRGEEATGDALDDRDPYTIFGVSSFYDFRKNARITAGISNLFDKRLQREDNAGGAGANTYNEPGRAFYVMLSAYY